MLLKTIHIINGPNLNLVGLREPKIYGDITFEEYVPTLQSQFDQIELKYFQSNYEGAILDYIHSIGFNSNEVAVINPGGLTHTSISLRDAIAGVTIPFVEVHISDINTREAFRLTNYIKDVCSKSIIGKGLEGYELAIRYLLES